MTMRIVLCGAVFCLGAFAQAQTAAPDKTTGSANREKQTTSTAAVTVTGCVDEQDGHYVLRDIQSSKLVSLQASGTDNDSSFAKFVGHQVQANGTGSSTSVKVTQIHQVADMCPVGN
jgi:sulfite reductase beta subunit-like hemoprotein